MDKKCAYCKYFSKNDPSLPMTSIYENICTAFPNKLCLISSSQKNIFPFWMIPIIKPIGLNDGAKYCAFVSR
jgi:hypothetical protein